jgi:sugar O-acyltransferase (sialic acid O-acetyltransferase NeuD family)
MKKVAIIGAGGFGREVKMLIDQINEVRKQYDILGFYDDNPLTSECNGLPILGKVDEVNNTRDSISIVLGIGDPKIKKQIISKLSNPLIDFPTLIHPNVFLGRDYVSIGKGTIICGGSYITCNIIIEDFVTINLSCTIGHDTIVKKYCSLMPAVNISGEVLIETMVYIGTGSKIINQLNIGENVIIGAGSVVTKSIPSNCTAVGVPAKPIKYHE